MPNDVLLTSDELKSELATLSGWEVRDDWLRREYKTPGFSHTMLLANAIGFVAEAAWHHPDLSLGYAQVIVKLQTHRVGGITWSDIELARKIHEIALWQPGDDSALDGFPKNWIK